MDSNTKTFKSDIINEDNNNYNLYDNDNNNNKYISPVFSFPTIKIGSNYSLLYVIARKSFSAYQSVLTQRLSKVIIIIIFCFIIISINNIFVLLYIYLLLLLLYYCFFL